MTTTEGLYRLYHLIAHILHINIMQVHCCVLRLNMKQVSYLVILLPTCHLHLTFISIHIRIVLNISVVSIVHPHRLKLCIQTDRIENM